MDGGSMALFCFAVKIDVVKRKKKPKGIINEFGIQ